MMEGTFMSIHNLTIEGSHKRPHAPLEEGLTSKRQRLDDSHPSGLEKLTSTATMEDQKKTLVNTICNLGTRLLENNPNVASAKFVEAELAKISSTDPRVNTLRMGILEIKKPNACEAPVPNGLSSAQPPQISPIENSSGLPSSGKTLASEEKSLSGPAQLAKLNEPQTKLEAALVIEPKNAFALFYLGDVLTSQAQLLSGPARSTKLKKAQDTYEASLKLDDLRKLLKPKKTQVETGRSRFLKIHP
jgi:hypothetical protein